LSHALQFAHRPERTFPGVDDRRPHFPERPHNHTRSTLRGSLRHTVSAAQPSPQTREADFFQEMFLSSRTRFVGLAYSIVQNKEDAEDAVQDAFLSAHVHLRTFEGRSAFTTWFTRIVLNAALMIRRKRKNSRLDSISDFCGEEETSWIEKLPGPQPNPEQLCGHAEACEFVNRVAARLNPILRQALHLAYHHELSSSEAAAELGVSTATFKSRVLRARQLLAKRATAALTPRKPYAYQSS